MKQAKARTLAKTSCFYLLTFAISTPFWWVMSRPSAGLLLLFGLMWSPALAAVPTKWVFRDPLGELGLSLKRRHYHTLAYALPFLYAPPVYLVVWLVDQEPMRNSKLATMAAARFRTGPLVRELPRWLKRASPASAGW